MRTSYVSLAIAALGGLLAVARPAEATWSRDVTANQPVAVLAGEQAAPRVATDGSGGVYIAWHDDRAGNQDIYVQRISAKGIPLWTVNGIAATTGLAIQSYPQVVSDGAGGAIVAYTDRSSGDYNIYAQRFNPSGVPLWGVAGVIVCGALNEQWHLELTSDGLGGAIAVWTDLRNDAGDIYTQRVDGGGNRLWTADGVLLSGGGGSAEEVPRVVADGTGGAIVCWHDWDVAAMQRVNANGVPQWTAGGVPVATWAAFPSIATDGAGGAIVAWMQNPFSCSDDGARIQRFNAAGAPMWGFPISGLEGSGLYRECGSVLLSINFVEITSDGAGGAFAVWSDRRDPSDNESDLYAQKVDATGSLRWTPGGVPVCTAPFNQQGWGFDHPIISDGAGGAIVTWHDPRVNGTTLDLYAQRLDASGVGKWGVDGKLLSAAVNSQAYPKLVADGRNGAIVTWQDNRSGQSDIYAQRIDRFGHLGDPSPEITSVADLPNDQGGRVRIRWNASYRDTHFTLEVGTYGIWRQVTEAAAVAAIARGASLSRTGSALEARRGVFRADAVSATWWEGVGSIPARGEPWYTFVAETFRDSTSAGNPPTTFMVDAHDAYVPAFWSSLSDSGYSVDNLPPSAPQGFAGLFDGSAMQLDWDPNVENDLAGYYLYRGTSADFVPSPANRVASPTGSGYADVGLSSTFYKVSAVDVHGNESGFASLTVTTDVATGPPRNLTLAFARPHPNPVRYDVGLRFTLPHESRVSLKIYDASGRLVRRLVHGVRLAGEHAATWDLRCERGNPVARGIYFVRFESGGRGFTERIAVVR